MAKQREILLDEDWKAGMSPEGNVELRLIGTKWTAAKFGAKYIIRLAGEDMARVDSMTEATDFITNTRALMEGSYD